MNLIYEIVVTIMALVISVYVANKLFPIHNKVKFIPKPFTPLTDEQLNDLAKYHPEKVKEYFDKYSKPGLWLPEYRKNNIPAPKAGEEER